MRWSKLRQQVEARFADSLAGRVQIHTTQYRDGHYDEDGRSWITVDKQEIANFPEEGTHLYHHRFAKRMWATASLQEGTDEGIAPLTYAMIEQEAGTLMKKQGQLCQWEVNHALFDSLSLSLDDMLRSEDGIIRALAMVDGRLGKRRLRALVLPDDELPLVRALYTLRCEADNSIIPMPETAAQRVP